MTITVDVGALIAGLMCGVFFASVVQAWLQHRRASKASASMERFRALRADMIAKHGEVTDEVPHHAYHEGDDTPINCTLNCGPVPENFFLNCGTHPGDLPPPHALRRTKR